MKLEIFSDAQGEWRYRIKGDNGEVMVSSEGYVTRSGARRGVRDLFENIYEADDAIEGTDG